MSERPTPDLEIVETRVYRGPNVWSYDKSIHLVVDLGSLEQFPTNTLPGFTDHSLVPKAARHIGIEMPQLCAKLADMAIRDHDRAHG